MQQMKNRLLRNFTAALAVAVSVALPVAAQDASGPILFTNVNVFDGVNEALNRKNANVVVTGKKITAVSTEPLTVAGGRVIDGKGRTLMPGLIDSHQHLSQGGLTQADLYSGNLYYIGIAQSKFAYGALMRGLTSVRDPAGDSLGLKRAIDEGLVPGPRIIASGPGIGPTNGHGDFNSLTRAIGALMMWGGIPADVRTLPTQWMARRKSWLQRVKSFARAQASSRSWRAVALALSWTRSTLSR